jgi:membrane-associated phospholipid phosphatase
MDKKAYTRPRLRSPNEKQTMKTTFTLTIATLLFLCVINSCYGGNPFSKQNDSLNYATKTVLLSNTAFFKAAKVPILLVIGGTLTLTDNEVLNREEAYEERQEHLPYFRTHLDDYLQFMPIAAAYGLRSLGVQGKNNWGNSVALLIKSEAIMCAIVAPMKHFTAVKRPDSPARNSFPSGHTAQAFTAASFLHKEYGHVSPLISFGAYSSAAAVAIFRVMNNRHWTPDVFIGAAIGILSTNLAYITHRYKWSKKASYARFSALPSYSTTNGTQLHFSLTF